MQTKVSNIKIRLAQFLGYLGIGQAKFAEIVGVSKGFANNVGDSIRTDNLEKIKNAFPELNTAWLLTGQGEMLNDPPNHENHNSPSSRKAGTANSFTQYTEEQIEEILTDRFKKHLLEMYEQGRAYPAALVERLLSEKDALLLNANIEIGRLNEELNRLKQNSGTPHTTAQNKNAK